MSLFLYLSYLISHSGGAKKASTGMLPAALDTTVQLLL